MAHYGSHQPYGYPQPPYGQQPLYSQQPYASQLYGHQHYSQQPYAHNQYLPPPPPPPYGQHPGVGAYGQGDPNRYPQYSEGYPSKKQKGNPMGPRYPVPPPNYPAVPHARGYQAPQLYAPQHTYQPAAIPPIPPPGWIPPPPPGWRGPVPPVPQPYQQPQGYQPYPAASHFQHHHPYQPPTPSYSPPGKQIPNQHNQAQHFQAHHAPHARSRQWIRPPDPQVPPTPPVPAPSIHAPAPQVATNVTAQHSVSPISNGASVPPPPTAKLVHASSQPSQNHHEPYVEDWDWDDYWYTETEEINADLSLGEIVWRPGDPVGRAVPAVWNDAEGWSVNPVPLLEKGSNETISQYATADDVGKCYRSVRDTSDWPIIKTDPVFADLTSDCNLIPVSEIIANRDRPAMDLDDMDLDDEEEGEITKKNAHYDWSVMDNLETALKSDATPKDPISSSEPGFVTSPVGAVSVERTVHRDREEDQQTYTSPPPEHTPVEQKVDIKACGEEKKVEVKAHIEKEKPGAEAHPEEEIIGLGTHTEEESQAESGQGPMIETLPEIMLPSVVPVRIETKANAAVELKLPPKPEIKQLPHLQPTVAKRRRSRSPERKHLPRHGTLPPKPPEFARDTTQEDILARLGVTGAPRPVFTTPGPAYMPLPEKPPVDLKVPLMSTFPAQFPVPPPPPPMAPVPEVDENPWLSGFDGSRDSPKSETSQHTLAGSDFHVEDDNETTPKARVKVDDSIDLVNHSEEAQSKKRTREESEELDDGIRRQKDDISSRLRKRQPRVAAAYGRRW